MLKAAAAQGELAEFLGRIPQPVVAAQLGQNRGSSSYKALLLFAAVFALPSDPSHAACKGSVCATSPTDLGTLGTNLPPTAGSSQAFAVSDKGTVVVGSAEFPLPSGSTQHAFLWQNGVMVDLGTLGGTGEHGASFALDVNGTGNIVVGAATNTTGETHAFRWTKSTGMVDIGTLAGFGATAWAVNGNGSVIVGQSDTLSHATHAFRWTSSGGMSDLGTLGGDSAIAYDVNDKGDVVVGSSTTGSSGPHAFRWTSAGMTDLGTLGGGNSQANAVDSSGSTVVGYSDTSGGARAFLWTAGTGMLNLGVLPGGDQSMANGVSADGSVIVGWSNSAGTSARAVRWAGAQGIQDLNLLLSRAGVDMTGVTLTFANGVSADGAFIVGLGDFSGANHGFLVRYEQGKPKKNGKPIAGMTTAGSLQDSINGLGEARQQSLIEQQAFAAPLTEPTAQLTLANGFSLLVNAAFAESDPQQGSVSEGYRAGLAVRYVPAEVAPLRPIVEIGSWTKSDASFNFEREYMNGAGTAVGEGYTNGSISNSYARAGIVLQSAPNDQLAVTAEIDRSWSLTEAYAESASATNPFEAAVSSGTDAMNAAKLRMQWSHGFGLEINATLWAAGARSFGDTIDLMAAVPMMGAVAPVSVTPNTWVEYGGRLGFALGPQIAADISLAGLSGFDEIGTALQLRGGAHIAF